MDNKFFYNTPDTKDDFGYSVEGARDEGFLKFPSHTCPDKQVGIEVLPEKKHKNRIYNSKYFSAKCGVRYWEDAIINGVTDTEGTLIPCRKGDYWCPLIEIETGRILNWIIGARAQIHYKVCDDGKYEFLDKDKQTIFIFDSYVPSILSPKEPGYGDYVIMDVDKNGMIDKWEIDLSEFIIEEKEQRAEQKLIPAVNIHPGEFIKEIMEEFDCKTEREFSFLLLYACEGEDIGEYITSHLKDIIAGRSILSEDLLERFETANLNDRWIKDMYNLRTLQENYLETEKRTREQRKDEFNRLFAENELLRQSKREIWEREGKTKERIKAFYTDLKNQEWLRLGNMTAIRERFEEHFPEVRE